MPLSDNLPVIDDRTYAEVVEEIRTRIPRYTSEWTDLNDSDPGMTLAQLFAWLTEMQIFRMNQVPKLNYLKFLELVGIELDVANAATARVTFPVDSAYSRATTIVPARTQIAAEEVENGPVLFELDQALIAIRASLIAVQSFDGFVYRDLTDRNTGDATFLPFGSSIGDDAALYLGFSESLPATTFKLTFWSQKTQAGIPVLKCSESEAFQTSRIAWEIWDGREWLELTILKDETSKLTRTGDVVMQGPEEGLAQSSIAGRIEDPLFWLRARVTRNAFQKPPALLAVRTNTGLVTQAETLEFESLGGSNGETNQTFRLADSPVLPGSLQLEVDEGQEGYQVWTEVDDFAGSGPDDRHYVLNRATGEVRFGNGRKGRIPVGNPRSARNVRARIYQVGGGANGNAAAGLISALQSRVDGIVEDAVGNLFAAAGGTEEETVDSAIERAPSTLKSQERAVTAEDFEALSLRAAAVSRARALPLFHPDYPGIEVPGVVTVIVVPDVDDPAPTPSEGTLNAVCAVLNERRLLTTEVHVSGPTYKTVSVDAEIIADDTADLAEVKEHALESLKLYFDPRHGGEESDPSLDNDDPARSGGGWPFGGDIYYSLLYRRLLAAGVKRIQSLTVTFDGEKAPPCQDVQVGTGLLLVSGEHSIDVQYDHEQADSL